MKRRSAGVLMVLAAAAGFGTMPIFGKLAIDAGLNNTTLLTYRFLLGTVVLWLGLVLWGRARLLRRRKLHVALALGVIYATFSGLFFWGLLFIPAGVAAITFYTYPVVVYLLAVTFLDESLTSRRLLALVFALAGVGLIVGGDAAGINVVGILLVLLSACGLAVYITGSRAALASIDADLLAGTALIATTLTWLAFGLVTDRLFVPSGSEQWLIILGIAVIGTSLPLIVYVRGLDRIEASRVAIISTFEPMVTVALGIALLGEILTLPVLAGGALVLVGVVVVQSEIASEARTAQ